MWSYLALLNLQFLNALSESDGFITNVVRNAADINKAPSSISHILYDANYDQKERIPIGIADACVGGSVKHWVRTLTALLQFCCVRRIDLGPMVLFNTGGKKGHVCRSPVCQAPLLSFLCET